MGSGRDRRTGSAFRSLLTSRSRLGPLVHVVGRAMPPSSNSAVLLVEDDTAIRGVLQLLLEDEGLVVQPVADGFQALAWAESNRPALVILDLGLPLLDGVSVATALRARYGERLPIIVVSADYRAAEKTEHLKPSGLLRKPFDVDMLVGAVQRELSIA